MTRSSPCPQVLAALNLFSILKHRFFRMLLKWSAAHSLVVRPPLLGRMRLCCPFAAVSQELLFVFLGVLLCTNTVHVSTEVASQVWCRFLDLGHVNSVVFVCLSVGGHLGCLQLCCSVAESCLTLCDPVDCSVPGSSVLHGLLELAQFTSSESEMPSNRLTLCRPLLLLPSIFPSITVFSNESALRIRWSKYWGSSFQLGTAINSYVHIFV